MFIAGAPRCGTTSIYSWLSNHPEVCGSNVKETNYFIDKEYSGFKDTVNFHNSGMEGYKKYFKHCNHKNLKLVFEATPANIYQNTALEVLSAMKPRPLIVFVLRKPSERLYSVFNHAKNYLAIIDREMTFKEFISLIGTETGEKSDVFMGRQFLTDAIENTMYIKYISKWIERFEGETNKIKVFLFEELKKDPVVFMKEFSMFAGIEVSFWDRYSFDHVNRSDPYKIQSVHTFIRKRLTRNLHRMGMEWPRIIRNSYTRLFCKVVSQRSDEDCMVLKDLDRLFLPYNELLAEKLGIVLTAWR